MRIVPESSKLSAEEELMKKPKPLKKKIETTFHFHSNFELIRKNITCLCRLEGKSKRVIRNFRFFYRGIYETPTAYDHQVINNLKCIFINSIVGNSKETKTSSF